VETIEKSCKGCGMMRTLEKIDSLTQVSVGPDPCWGDLPGVKSACCGHGETRGYIQFDNGIILRLKLIQVEKAPKE
jgi:hypothetical protein